MENVNATKNQKIVIFRYMTFNPTLGIVEPAKHGGVMILAIPSLENPNKLQIKAIICKRDKIFRKQVASKLLFNPNLTPVMEVDDISLESLLSEGVNNNNMATKLITELQMIHKSKLVAEMAQFDYNKKMQHSGASVYDYIP